MTATDWTARSPNTENFALIYQNRIFRADSGSTTAIEYGHPYWQVDLTFDVLDRQDERKLSAMLSKLKGIYGTIKVPCWTRTRTDDKGNIVLNIAVQDAASITVAATTAPSQQIFSAGDYISFGGEMFEVTDDVTAASDGSAIVYLNKRLRTTYAINTPVEYKNPFCVMRMDEDTLQFNRQAGISSCSVTFVEAF